MRKFYIITSLFLLSTLAYPQKKLSVDDKIKISVKKYLSLTMNDYKSYQPVMWGKVEKIYTTFNSDGMWDFLTKKVDSCNYIVINYKNKIDENQSEIKDDNERSKNSLPYYRHLYDSLASVKVTENVLIIHKRDSIVKVAVALQNFYDEKEKAFVPSKIEGYKIDHTFRGKNAFGGLVIQNYAFILDEKFNITSSKMYTDQ